MTRNTKVGIFVGAVVVFGMCLIFLSLSGKVYPVPPEWLKEWTEWVTKYVALVVAAVGVVNVANSVGSRLRHGTVPKTRDSAERRRSNRNQSKKKVTNATNENSA